MNKKVIAVICILAIGLSVFAAGCKKKTNTLVVYFNSSYSVAETANITSITTGGDLYELKAEKAYSDDELALSDKNQRVKKEQSDAKAENKVKNPVKNIKKYEKVYVVYPVWYNKAPRVIIDFVKNTELNGKKVIPLAVSNTSDITPTLDELMKAAPKAKWIDGVRFSEKVSSSTIDAWVRNCEEMMTTTKASKEKK